MADNDLGLGQVVELVSQSSIWKDSAIFVVEDDSQDGVDSVDAHRIPAFVISPWAKHGGQVIHTRYDQYSFLRTIELILGLDPLSINDALATPLYDAFISGGEVPRRGRNPLHGDPAGGGPHGKQPAFSSVGQPECGLAFRRSGSGAAVALRPDHLEVGLRGGLRGAAAGTQRVTARAGTGNRGDVPVPRRSHLGGPELPDGRRGRGGRDKTGDHRPLAECRHRNVV